MATAKKKKTSKISVSNGSSGTSGMGSIYLSSQAAPSNIMVLSASNGSPIFTIKPNGEFVPGPGMDYNVLPEFTKMIYKQMKIFGKSFAETLEDKDSRIIALEKELEILKNQNGTSN
jgi:hypothetical protein